MTNGVVDTSVAATRVLFDGIASPMIYALSSQTSAMAPYEVTGRSTVNVVVEYQGVQSSPVEYTLTPTAPGIYSQNAQGTGPGAILNQDASINSATNPALRGSVISLFGTGSGAATPQIATGALMLTTPYPAPQNNVTVTIGGQPAQILYAGAAPTLPNGVFQINVRVPANIAAGDAAAIVTVGGISTFQVVTVPVR